MKDFKHVELDPTQKQKVIRLSHPVSHESDIVGRAH